MYLRIVLTLLAMIGSAIAVRLWTLPAPSIVEGGSNATIMPYSIWPHDNLSADPTLEKKLAKVQIKAASLEDALVQLRELSGVNIVWQESDVRFRTLEGLRLDLENVTLRTALEQLLIKRSPTPTFETRYGVVLINSHADIIRFYDLKPLLAVNPNGEQFGRVDGRRTEVVDIVGMLTDSLSESHVKWTDLGNRPFWEPSLFLWNGILIARQTPEGHRKIVRILETLRGSGDGTNSTAP